MAKFCKNCGVPIEEGAGFCPGCGEPVGDAALGVPPADSATVQAYGQPVGDAAPGVPPQGVQPVHQAPPPAQQQYAPPGQQQYAPPGQQQYAPPGQQQYETTQAYGQPVGDAALGVPPPGVQPVYQAPPEQPQKKPPKWLWVVIVAAAAVVALLLIMNLAGDDGTGKDDPVEKDPPITNGTDPVVDDPNGNGNGNGTVTRPAEYVPLDQPGSFLTVFLEPDFIDYGTPCWFNAHEVVTAENNPGGIGPAGLAIENRFAWAEFDDGSGRHCLCAALDAETEWGGENYNLFVPGYGLPVIEEDMGGVIITWTHLENPGDRIRLMFSDGSNLMTVSENSLRFIDSSGDPDVVEMAASAFRDDTGLGRYFVPLYAIINEVDGGVMFDQFGAGAAFIYTGNVIRGYSGYWEVMNDSEYRNDAVINGETVSVGNYWWSLELAPDGTFTDADLYYQDEGSWIRTVKKGEYAFFGRILAMRYITESEYLGDGPENLEPLKVDEPHEGWDNETGSSIYARYIDDWNDPEALFIRDFRPLYSNALSGQPTINF